MDTGGMERVCGQGGRGCSSWEWGRALCSQGWSLPGHLGTLFPSGFLGNLGLDSDVFVVLFAYNFSI